MAPTDTTTTIKTFYVGLDQADADTAGGGIFGGDLKVLMIGQTASVSSKSQAVPIVELDSLLPDMKKQVAEAMSEKSYWHCDPFRRRDGLTSLTNATMSMVEGKAILLARDVGSPETRDLVTALAGAADVVIRL